MPMDVSDEGDQVSSRLRGNLLFTVYTFALSIFYIILVFKLKEGNQSTFEFEKENNGGKNRIDKTNPMSSLWNSDRRQLIDVLELWQPHKEKLMADTLIDGVIQQVIQAPRPLFLFWKKSGLVGNLVFFSSWRVILAWDDILLTWNKPLWNTCMF